MRIIRRIFTRRCDIANTSDSTICKHTTENGILHNETGPAVVRNDGTEEWWYKGRRVCDPYRCVKRTYYNSEYNFERWKNISGQYHRPIKGPFSGPAKIDHAGKYWMLENRLIKFEPH